MYFLLIGLVVLNLFTLKGNARGEDKICSIKFLMIRFFLPLMVYCLLIFMLGTKFASVLGVIGVINTMIDVRCQHLKTKKDEKISYYNKSVVEVNSYLIIFYTLLFSYGMIL